MGVFNGNSIYNDGAGGGGGGGGGDWEDVSNKITYDSLNLSPKLFYNASCKLYNLVIDSFLSTAPTGTTCIIAFDSEIIEDVYLYDFYTHDDRRRSQEKDHFTFTNLDLSIYYGGIVKDRFNYVFTGNSSIVDCRMYVNILFRGK